MNLQRQYTRRSFLDALEERVLIYDGANGTLIESFDLTPGHFGGEQYNGCFDYLAVTFPEAVEKVLKDCLVSKDQKIQLRALALYPKYLEITKPKSATVLEPELKAILDELFRIALARDFGLAGLAEFLREIK